MENKSSGRGFSLLNILTIIFVISKILGFINWSWWLVFTPTFISIGIFILVVVFAIVLAVLDKD